MIRFQYSSFAVGTLSWSGTSLAAASNSRNITVYPDVLREAAKGDETLRRFIFPVDAGPVLALSFAGKGTLLSALDAAGKVYWIETEPARTRTLQLQLAHDLSTTPALSRSGRFLTAGTSSGALKIWDVWDRNPDTPTTISGPLLSVPVVATVLSRDEQFAAFASKDGAISVWETEGSFDHAGSVRVGGTPSTLVFDRRARRLAVGTDGGEVSVWEFDPYRSTLCGTWRADDTLSALTFTKGGRHIVGLHSSGVVSIWKVRTGELVQRIARADKRFTAFAIAPHDATLAVGDDGGWIELVPISDVTARKWFRLG